MLDLMQLMRTAQGSIPSRTAELVNDIVPHFEFQLLAPEEATAHADMPPLRLDDFALNNNHLKDALALAQQTGPLFGKGSRESVASWQFAMSPARQAVLLQEALNAGKLTAAATEHLVKERYQDEGGSLRFPVFTFVFPVSVDHADEYVAFLRELPKPHVFQEAEGSDGADYATFTYETQGDLLCACVQLFCFEEEIGLRDFASVLYATGYGEATGRSEDAQRRLIDEQLAELQQVMPDSQSRYDLANARFEVSEDAFSLERDAMHLQHMVQALAALHLEGVRIDLFRSRQEDGFMTFPSVLSHLWYHFAQNLDKVEVAICPICGNGFSVTRHRGPAKVFCSQRCKEAAKNQRRRLARDEARRLFLDEGRTVEDIRRATFSGKEGPWTRAQVVAQLQGWVRLRHAREEDPVLVARCLAEGVIDKREAKLCLAACKLHAQR